MKRVPALSNNYANIILADAPVGYWRLGEASGNAADSSGNGLTATPTGTPTYGVAGALGGDTNKAMTFDGSTNFLSAGTNALFDITAALSLECWINPADQSGNRYVIAKYNSGNAALQSYLLYVKQYESAVLTVVTAGPTNNQLNSNAPLPIGQWTHVVGTYDGATMKVYVNGRLDTSLAKTGAMLVTAAPLVLAGRSGLVANLPGSLDEVAVYNVALTADQVMRHYIAGGARTRTALA